MKEEPSFRQQIVERSAFALSLVRGYEDSKVVASFIAVNGTCDLALSTGYVGSSVRELAVNMPHSKLRLYSTASWSFTGHRNSELGICLEVELLVYMET